MKIVVRAPNWIGDSVLALSAIESLRKNLPEAQIWVASEGWVKDLFISHDFIEGIIPLSKTKSLKDLKGSAKKIQAQDFDAGVLFTNSFASALLFYLAKIPERWGYSRDGRGLLLTKRVSRKKLQNSGHQADYYMELISRLGFKSYPPKLFLPLTQEEINKASELLHSLKVDLKLPVVVLHPGASYGPSKRWPAERFAALGDILRDRNKATILITGAADEKELAGSISSIMKNKTINLSGRTSLRMLAGLISRANLFVTNDSGPMHMANALGTPLVAVFGPTDPRATGPYQEPAAVIKKDVPCWPCSYRDCPFDHRCMMKISVEEVYKACQRFFQ
jgi:heptosyltransferase-2